MNVGSITISNDTVKISKIFKIEILQKVLWNCRCGKLDRSEIQNYFLEICQLWQQNFLFNLFQILFNN